MIEMKLDINITGLGELAASIMALANSFSKNVAAGQQPSAAPIQGPSMPMQAPMTEQMQEPFTPEQTAPASMDAQKPSVPVSTATYTLMDLANAARAFMDGGEKQTALQQLLRNFGVVALPQLPEDRYAEFAAALRGMGALI